MKTAGWMAGASLGSWAAISVFVDKPTALAMLGGMLAPLAVAVVSWTLAERTYTRHPESLTSVMITAFGGKLLFFPVYVVVMLRGLGLSPLPFAASFAGYFVALLVAEALSLRGLFAGGAMGSC